MIKYFLGLYFVFTFAALGQQANFSGTVSNGTLALSDVFLKASSGDKSATAISDENGRFLIKNLEKSTDSITIEAFKNGFKKKIARFASDSSTLQLVLEDSILEIAEVVITSDKNAAANKKTYRIDSKEYIRNAKTDVVLKSLPSVSVTSSGIIVDNRKKAVVFIDGIESGIEEVNRLRADEVDKIEIMGNPSALYGSGTADAVVQIFTAKKKERLIKSELESYAGVRLGAFGVIPSVAFKTESVLFKAFYSYGTNNQNIDSEVFRIENGQSTAQRNFRKVEGYQQYFSSRLRILLTEKSSIALNSSVFSYKFNGTAQGTITRQGNSNPFSVDDDEGLQKNSFGGVYAYSPDPNNRFFAKFNYFSYKNENSYRYFGASESGNEVYSETKDRSFELVYEKRNIVLFNTQVVQTFGYKNIRRDFDFRSNSYALEQDISSFYTDSNIKVSDKLSAYASLNFDVTKNENEALSQKYNYLLAALSLSYKLTDSSSLQANYSKKINRPGPNELNPEPILLSPIYILQGNSALLPQLKNTFELQFFRTLKNDRQVGITWFAEDTRQAIVEVFKPGEEDIIVNSYENSGKRFQQGASANLSTPLSKNISLNLNSGITYSNYESSSENSLVRANDGLAFVGSFYLNMLVKERLSLSLDGNYVSRNYSLVSTSESLPVFNLYAEYSFFKSRLNTRLSYTDIFALGTETSSRLSYSGFTQNTDSRNRTTNLVLTLIYNFGKKFSDRVANKSIINDDIKLK